ncbi:hypothetical protein RHSIM_Rhsim11G0145000 [Rhododendron simsii]|uniref:Uncharacterized protein n=1 Tax=Rhododendron simsii TaxID=118357 RepID=A0A834G871_RHOSS|nr:hypothetical protein RHSIM_Rhsim11G0145000 [Rhododendron simsii]
MDAVDCPEWIVPFHIFKSLAEERGQPEQPRVNGRRDKGKMLISKEDIMFIDQSSTSVAISRCCFWVVTADEVQVAGDGFIGLEVHLVGPLLRRGGFKINRDASLRAIFCVLELCEETHVSSILQAEAMANLHACILAKAMNLPRIEVQGDNKQVIKLLCVTEAEPRKANKAANWVAKSSDQNKSPQS